MSSQSSNRITFLQATIMSINIMVGAGVFLGPGAMAALCGNASFLGWILAAGALLPIVYNIARLPEIMPGAGGVYLYCKQGLGKTGGYAGGWLYFLCYNISLTTVLSAFHSSFLSMYPNLFALQSKLVFLSVCLVTIFLLNLLSTQLSAKIQSYFTYFKLVPIITPIALLPFFLDVKNLSFSFSELSLLPQTLPLAIFAFFGFEFCCNLSDKVEGGAKAAKKSILAGFLGVTALYALFHFSLLNIMGSKGLLLFQASGYSAFIGTKFPIIASILAYLLPITLFVTFFNSSYGLLFLEEIILQSLADDKMLRFSSLFSQRNSNGRAWFCALIATLFSLFVGVMIEDLNNLAIACNLVLFLLFSIVMAALFKAEQHKPFDFNRFAIIIGIFFGLGLVGFNWMQISGSLVEKIQAMIPLFVGMFAGVLLFNYQGTQNRQNKATTTNRVKI